jgi:gliding motility-associated-like protein
MQAVRSVLWLGVFITGLLENVCGVNAQCDQETYRLQFDGPGSDVGHRVLAHGNGDVYVAGYSSSFSTDNDLVLARFTVDGILVWAKRYDIVGDDGGQSMYLATGPSGALYIGATLNGIGTNQEDGALLKLDENGTVIWARRVLPMPFYCQVRAVAERPDGDVIAVGSANSIGAGNADAWAARFTSDGDLVWLNSYGWSGQDHFTHVELLADGSFTACSQSMGPDASNRKAMVAHIGEDGVPLVCRLHDGGVSDTYNHGVANPDGTYLYVGFTESYGAGARDVLAVLTSATGDRIWSRTYGTVASEEGLNAVVDPAGGWRIAAFQGLERVAHVLHVLPNGALSDVGQIQDLVIPTTGSWAEVLDRSPDGGLVCIGMDPAIVSGSNLSVVKLDACAESDCGGSFESWTITDPDIPQLEPELPISDVSMNAASVDVETAVITGEWTASSSFVDCDTCGVVLVQGIIQACLGEPVDLDGLQSTVLPDQTLWSWNFGDGSMGADPYAVVHVYSSVGTFLGEVSVVDTVTGCADTAAFTVTVSEVVLPLLGGDTVLCPGAVILLDPGDAEAATITWWDGSNASVQEIAVGGSYWVEFDQDGCLAYDTINVLIPSLPDLLQLSDTTLCQGQNILVTTTFGWSVTSWSDGTTGDSLLIDATGSYIVTADSANCSSSDTLNVQVIELPVVDIGMDLVLCPGDTVTLATGFTGIDHLWSDGSQGPSLEVFVGDTIWVTVGPAACSASDTVLVSSASVPSLELGPDLLLCDQVSAQLGPVSGDIILWSTGDVGPVISVAEEGSIWVEITVQNCLVSDTLNVTIGSSPSITLPGDTVLCGMVEFQLFPVAVTSAQEWLWSSGATDTSIMVSGTDEVWVWVSNACGFSTDTTSVQFLQEPEVDLGPDRLICGEEAVLLDAGHPDALTVWNDTWSGAQITVDTAGTYWVSVDMDGCVGRDTVEVEWAPLPHIELPADTVVCDAEGVEVQVVAVEGGEVQWSTGAIGPSAFLTSSGQFLATTTNACGSATDSMMVVIARALVYDSLLTTCWDETPIQLPNEYHEVVWSHGDVGPVISVPVGDYGWNAIDAFGCMRSGTIRVMVDTVSDGSVYVPNVFTPNGDQVNDVFRAYGAESGQFSLSVFNRWGQEIWRSTDPTLHWDGREDGSEVPDGTYTYMLEFEDTCMGINRTMIKYGHVTVLR